MVLHMLLKIFFLSKQSTKQIYAVLLFKKQQILTSDITYFKNYMLLIY